MRSSPPTRLPDDIYASAAAEAARTRRSVAQQLAHWAELGRELEASPGINARDIANVLAGDDSYDRLGEREQAVVRAKWQEGIDEDIRNLDLAAEFTAAGRSWAEADEDGNLVLVTPPGADDTSKPTSEPLDQVADVVVDTSAS